jgi:raffinose/stachyose/melibiose transport system permease protein
MHQEVHGVPWKGRLRRRLTEALGFAWLTLPAVLLVTAFVIIPFIMSLTYSFTKWNGLDKVPTFIGLANYIALARDASMARTLAFTFKYMAAVVVLTNVVALVMAVLLDNKVRGERVLRTGFFLPYIISLIVVGYIWKFILSKGFTSLFDLSHISVFGLSWLGDGTLAFLSVVFVSVWQALGFYLVVYIAGLQTVPREVMEAATIDGAGAVRRFFRVTLPLIMASVTVCVFYAITNGLKAFDVIFVLTEGGPGTATTSVDLNIYLTAFIYSRFGYGTAQSAVLFLFILVVTVLQLTVFKSREVEA